MKRHLLVAVVVALTTPAAAAGAVAPGRVVLPNGFPEPVADVDAGGGGPAIAAPGGGVLVAADRPGGGVRLTALQPGGGAATAETAVAGMDDVRQVERLPDGRVLVMGVAGGGPMVLLRVLPDGRPDPAYGSGGVVRTPVDAGCGCARVAVAPDGAVLVTGQIGRLRPGPGGPTDIRGGRWVVVRYTATGAPDPAFGRGGIVLVPGVVPDSSAGYDVAVAPGGGVRLVGLSEGNSIVTGLTTTGAADPTFNLGRPFDLGPNTFARNLVVRADGAVDVLSDQRIVRLTALGTLDRTFGAGGQALVEAARQNAPTTYVPGPGGTTLAWRAEQFEPVLAGTSTVVVRRIDAGGRVGPPARLVTGFGGGVAGFADDGRGRRQALPVAYDSFLPRALVPRPGGGLLAVGGVAVRRYTGEGEGSSSGFLAAAAFTPDLRLDPAFGGAAARPAVRVTVPPQRARSVRRAGRLRVRVQVSAPGLLTVRVRDGRGRLLAHGSEAAFAAGRSTVPVTLREVGFRALDRGARRIAVAVAVRDLLGTAGRGTRTTRLR